MMDLRSNDQPAPDVPGYRLLGRLGSGGMATVFLAEHESSQRRVALKVMSPILAADPNYGERFTYEAQIAAGFSHPNIILVYDIGTSDYLYYLATEYLPGGDLGKRLQRNMTTKRAMVIVRQIASALDYAHRKGYVHRDVKPGNILFRDDGSAVLSDFGIARPAARDRQETQLGIVVGTPEYMSPEQTRGQPLDARSDLYSLGIVLYEMLNGKVPYEGSNAIEIGIKHIKQAIPTLPEDLEPLQPVLDQLLAKDPADRYRDARQLIEDIDALRMGALRNRKREEPAADAESLEPAALSRSGREPEVALAEPRQTPPKKRARAYRPHWRRWALGTLLAATAAGVYHAHDTGRIAPILATISDHSAFQEGTRTLQTWTRSAAGWVETLPEQVDTWLAQFRNRGVVVGSEPSAEEQLISVAAAESVGAAFGIQQTPGRVGSANLAARTAAALADIKVATLPRIDKQTEIINEILTRAATLSSEGRLFEPAEDSALGAYREVLILDEGNPAAEAGIEALTLGVVNDVSEAISAGDLQRARETLQQADRAELNSVQLDLARQRLEEVSAEEQRKPERKDADEAARRKRTSEAQLVTGATLQGAQAETVELEGKSLALPVTLALHATIARMSTSLRAGVPPDAQPVDIWNQQELPIG